MVEALGVLHTEVELILLNGESVGFDSSGKAIAVAELAALAGVAVALACIVLLARNGAWTGVLASLAPRMPGGNRRPAAAGASNGCARGAGGGP